MSLKVIFSRKYKVGLKIRLEVLGDILREWFNDWWLLVLSLVILIIGLGLVLRFQLIGFESARWTLSALVQAGAALIGIFFVALGLLWSQANQEHDKLKGLIFEYMSVFSEDTVAVNDLFSTFSEIAKEKVFQSSRDIRFKVIRCFQRFLVLQSAASRFFNRELPLNKMLSGSPIEGLVTEEELKLDLRVSGIPLYTDEYRFFRELLYFDDELSSLETEFELTNKGSFHLSEALHKARVIDKVGVSLYKIAFFTAFSGKSLKIISAMWLICISIGLLTLLSLDMIPSNLFPYLVSITVAIGVLAVGTTLSLGLRATRLRE